VLVTGTLKQRSHQPTEGPRRYYTEILIDEVGPALRFATAEVTKAGSRPGQRQNAPAQTAAGATWPTSSATANPWPVPATTA
jgi:single-strand DNA-binding protein